MKTKTIKTTYKKSKKIKQRERKSDCLIAVCESYSKRPKLASIALDKRLTNMYSSCRTRDKKYERETHFTISMLRELAKTVIGKPCKYCGEIIDHNNISMDHIVPLSRGGNSTIENIQLICKKCNTQKDKMLDYEFTKLKELVNSFSDESRIYVNKKLSMLGGFNGYYKNTENSQKTNQKNKGE